MLSEHGNVAGMVSLGFNRGFVVRLVLIGLVGLFGGLGFLSMVCVLTSVLVFEGCTGVCDYIYI